MTVVKVVEHLGDGGGRKEIGLNPGGVGDVARFVVVDNGTFAFVIAMLRNVAEFNVSCKENQLWKC